VNYPNADRGAKRVGHGLKLARTLWRPRLGGSRGPPRRLAAREWGLIAVDAGTVIQVRVLAGTDLGSPPSRYAARKGRKRATVTSKWSRRKSLTVAGHGRTLYTERGDQTSGSIPGSPVPAWQPIRSLEEA
jgi:hypothetical protein